MTISAKQVQPEAIFNHADTFFHALNQLHRSPPGIIRDVGTPVMVISAFASELYFKTLIALAGKKPAWGHDLKDLFSGLSPKMQGHLENRWNPIVRDREELYKNIDRQERAPIPRALPDAITEGREGFERLRYIYEGGDPFRFILSDLPLALRRTILDLQPSWGQQDGLFLGRIEGEPIPEHLKEGTITAWLRHPDRDWSTNNKHYEFGIVNANEHSIIAYKTADCRLSLTISGPLGRTFTFNEATIPADERGLMIAVTWSPVEILLYLNGKAAAQIIVGADKAP
jgi:hypothetical protein